MTALLIAMAVLNVALLGYRAYRQSTRPQQPINSRGLLAATKPTPIAALKNGERARITGTAAAREELLTSPIGGYACIGYSVLISEIEGLVVSREACKSFSVTDGTGTAVVEGPFRINLDPDDAAWAHLPPPVYALLDEAKVPLTVLGREREFNFKEALLKPGDRVSVLGRASLEVDPAGRGSHREPPMLHHITGSEDAPVIVADDEGGSG